MTIELKVNGRTMPDFSRASIRLSMETFAHTFAFTFSDRWIGTGFSLEIPFKEFDPCEVWIDNVKVIDGYIDDIPIDYDDTSHTIGVSGMSWAGHMVESSATHKAGSWRNVDALTVCRDVAKPFGVEIVPDVSAVAFLFNPPFSKWAIEDGETAFDLIMRVLRDRGCFAISGAGRDLIITRAGLVVAPGLIELGRSPIKSASVTSRFRERHNVYVVKSQAAEEFKVLFEDPAVAVHRPLVIVSDGRGGFDDETNRARWEMTTRIGKSRRLRYNFQGYVTPAGQPWQINTRMAVRDRFLDVDDTLLVCSIQIEQSTANTTTTVELCKPEAFDVLTPPPKRKGRKKF